MPNPIRQTLDTHAGKGYKHLTAAEEDLFAIYLRARNQIERRLSTFLQRKKASFTGPQLVTLFEDLQAIFPEMEEQYRSVYEDSLSYMAKQNYAAFRHDMGLEENVLGSMDKTLFDNMKQDGFTHIAGATQRMQSDVISNLRKMSARVMREAALTGMTRAEVSRKLAFENGYGMDSLFQQNGQKGGSFQFIDAAGKQWKTDAYFKMLGRTLLHNNSRECYLSACAKEGSDIVTISISGDPCEVCAKYENRLLSISGKTQGLVTLEQAMSEGLFHPNCTHRMIAVPEVVAQEYYDKDGKEKAEYRVDWENHLLHQQIRKEQREEARLNREDRKKAEEDRKKAAHEAHLKHRQKQLSQAKKNRTKREAELIGADLIKGEHTRQDDLKATNPNYNKSKEWNVNCQRVVYAYEARRRGYDVVALPKILEDQGYDPMNDHFEEVCHNMQWNSPNNPTAQGALDAINKAMAKFGNDSRAVVYVEWERDNPAEKRQAHVYIAENIEGKIKYVDPQNDDDNVDAYFWGAIPENTSFARLDNLKFSNYIKLCCERRKP